MNRTYFAFICMCFFAIQSAAMEKQLTKLEDVGPYPLKAIARYVNHKTCAHARQTCKILNATFWNDSDPICIMPDENTRNIRQKVFWKKLLAKIHAAETMIARYNQAINPKETFICNAIILKIAMFRKLSYLPFELKFTSYIRSLDLSGSQISVLALGEIFPSWNSVRGYELLPLLYELNLSHNGIYEVPDSFIHWTTLRSLDLSYNCLGFDRIQSLLSLPRQLEELDFSDNGLVDLPLGYLANFKCLRRLKLAGNMLHCSACLEKMAECLPNVEELDLCQNDLLLEDLLKLAPFNNLKKLNLKGRPESEGYQKWKENPFTAEQQKLIQKLFPHAKIIFP